MPTPKFLQTLAMALCLSSQLNLFASSPAPNSHEDERLKVTLASAIESIDPKEPEPFLVAVRFNLKKHWHLYWKNPGDSGMPPTIEWRVPEGFFVAELPWPAPKRIDWDSTGDGSSLMTVYGYEDEVVVVAKVVPPKGFLLPPNQKTLQISATISWLVCKEVCVPGDATLRTTLALASSNNQQKPSREARLIEEAVLGLPKPLEGSNKPIRVDAEAKRDFIALKLTLTEKKSLSPSQITDINAFPYDEGVFLNAKKPTVERLGSKGFRLQLPLDSGAPSLPESTKFLLQFQLQGGSNQSYIATVPVSREGRSPPSTSGTGGTGGTPFFLILLYGFLGGLILNAMPCVLPILSLKVLGVVKKSEQGFRQRLNHGLFYALGVVAFLWLFLSLILALKSQGERLGWGFQFQSPVFVSFMAFLFFVIGLNLSGVFEFGLSMTRLGGFRSGDSGKAGDSASASKNPLGAFAGGALMMLVATPCMAPFLGVSLGYALNETAGKAFATFTSIGLGLSLPYVFFLAFPRALKWLPKPGAWMERFKQAMAFPIYATSAWFLSLLAKLLPSSALIAQLYAMVLVGVAAWIYGTWVVRGRSTRSKGLALAVVVVVAFVALASGFLALDGARAGPAGPAMGSDSEPTPGWEAFSPKTLSRHLDLGHPVFINFTATWCLTCQVNKATTFKSEKVKNFARQRNIALLEADWTDKNQEITELIYSYGGAGVPIYVLYPNRSEGDRNEFALLPETLTPSLFTNSIKKIMDPKTTP